MRRLAIALCLLLPLTARADGNRLAYLDEVNPYYPSRTFPKLTTPQWVGEPGVDAIVILAIDDMRGPDRWEQYLRPILNRLKKIDGRAPVSIMTCQVDPKHPQLQTWLKEGLSLEVHTIDHPCPLLQKGDFAKAKSTYDRCVDLMNEIPGNKPVCFRTPCCDSLNTVSPRFFAEIFNKTTPKGHFLQADSSVFTVFTANDPELPRELVLDADGRERFRKYLPAGRSFVNTIEDYPYPYVIGRLCWEFPCMTPSDWQAQFLHKPNNPLTVRDWMAALDCTVIKKGVFAAVFHPHGWIKAEQVIDFVEYAQSKYGKRVKFLTFRDAVELLNKNAHKGVALRDPTTGKQPERQTDWLPQAIPIRASMLIDVGGGKKWLITANDKGHTVYTLKGEQRGSDQVVYEEARFTLPTGAMISDSTHDYGLRFYDLDQDGYPDVIFSNEKEYGIYLFTDMEHGWSRKVMAGKAGEPGALPPIAINGKNNGFWAHSGHLWWQNEHTDHLKDHVDRRSINELLANVEPTAKTPEASLKAIHTRPGFRAELMAAEPLVQDPIAFAFGPDGKLWVVEMGDYPLGRDGKGKFGGKVKFLESTKGDGKYDKATVFLDGLGFPTGVLPWRDGVLVTCAPDIFYVECKDGKPGRREVLFTGFGQGNQQHRVNTLAWGLDNWLYVANGDSGGTIRSLKTGKTVNISGRDLRIRPDTGELEAVTGQTQFGRSRDDWGNWFGGNNANPVWHFALDDRYLRRNPHVAPPDARVTVPAVPGAAPVFPVSRTLPRFNDPHTANRFTSACSPIVYRDTLYGPAFENNIFISEPVHNLIHREIMRPNGVTFRSTRAPGEEQSEFLASADNWFRPTTIATGPDGCLWIADMYRAVIEHPQWIPKDWQAKLDLRAGHDLGRIYRVVPVGVQPRPIPRLDQLDTAGLVAALDSPNGWQRDTAQMMLLWRNDAAAVPLLEKMARESSRALARLHALCTLDGMGRLDAKLLQVALDDAHPGVRRHAIRLSEGRLKASPELAAALAKLIDDTDPQVRMQLAYSLGHWDNPKAAASLARLAGAAGDDPYMLAAVLSSVNRDNLDAVARVVLSAGRPTGQLTDTFLGMSIKLGQFAGAARLLDAVAQPVPGRSEPQRLAAVADLLEALDRRGATLTAEMAKRLAPAFASARALVADERAALPDRATAVRLLGGEPTPRPADIDALAGFLAPLSPDELQSAAVAALGRLGRFGGDRVPRLLLERWKSYGPTRRAQVLDVLLRREDSVFAVLRGLAERQIDPSEIDTVARQKLLSHRAGDIRKQAEKLFAAAVSADRQKVIDAYRPALALTGDAARGKELFVKACAACHKLGGVGNEVGPDLAPLAGRSAEYLLVQVLDPNRAVEARFVNYLLETRAGVSLTGVLLTETSTSVTLVGTDGKPQTILRTNLEALTSTGRSAMPEGLEKDLSHQGMADVLAYVKANATAAKPKTFAGNKPELVTPALDGTLRLLATNAEVHGPSLVFEPQYRNLGYWGSADDRAVWTAVTLKPGKYEVWLDWACAAGAGGTFALESDAGRLTGHVASTGNWDTYKQAKVGELTLAAGRQSITMRAEGTIRGALIDLRGIRLVPVK